MQTIAGAALPVLAFYGSFHLLPAMAEVLAPRGINAGTAQNTIIIVAGVIGAWLLLTAFLRRLRTVGELTIFAWIAIVPPALVLLVDGPVFLRPLLPMPELLRSGVYFVSAGIAVWIFVTGLVRSTR